MDPYRWPPGTDEQVAYAEAMKDFNGWAALAFDQAMEYEGNMFEPSVFYGWNSAWARSYVEPGKDPRDWF